MATGAFASENDRGAEPNRCDGDDYVNEANGVLEPVFDHAWGRV